jgi:hypothetical protein
LEPVLFKILTRIDLPTLHKLVGVVILNAIKSVNKGEDETELSKILILKFDKLILNEKEIREAIINSLNKDEIKNLASQCELKSKVGSIYSNTIDFFSRGYNEPKSKIFADFLGLDNSYYFKDIIDTRSEKELITAPYGEQVNILSYLHPYQKRVKDEVMYRLAQKNENLFLFKCQLVQVKHLLH